MNLRSCVVGTLLCLHFQASIKRDCPNATFIHCQSHCLNLSIRSSSEIRDVQAAHTTIAAVCNYFAYSSVRTAELAAHVVEKRIAGEVTTMKTRPKAYCPTRFVEGAETVFTFVELYPALISYFEHRHEFNLVNGMSDPVFIVCVHLLMAVLGETRGLSVQLQAKAMDLVKATDEVDRVIERLKQWRTDNQDAKFLEAFAAAVQMYGHDIPQPRVNKRQNQRNNVPAVSPFEYYKRAIWYPILDQTVADLQTRFSTSSKVAMRIAQLLPEHCNDAFAVDCANAAFEQYSDHVESLHLCMAEFARWQHWCSRLPTQQRNTSLNDALTACNATLFPNIRKLLHIFATLPVTTCSAERSFSVLRLLKTYLRSVA